MKKPSYNPKDANMVNPSLKSKAETAKKLSDLELQKEIRYRDFQISILKKQLQEREIFVSSLKSLFIVKFIMAISSLLKQLKGHFRKISSLKNTIVFLFPFTLKAILAPRKTLLNLRLTLNLNGQNCNISNWKALSSAALDMAEYKKWIAINEEPMDLKSNDAHTNPLPILSIVMMVSQSTLEHLKKTIQVLETQTFLDWSLHIVNSTAGETDLIQSVVQSQQTHLKTKILYHSEYTSITNVIETINHGYILFLNQYCYLANNCLHWIANAIAQSPNCKLFYSDEDILDMFNRRHSPHFKPEFNYELFLTHNIIGRLAIFDVNTLKKLSNHCLDASIKENYELILNFIEHISPNQVSHIPKILVHCKAQSDLKAETSVTYVKAHLKRTKKKGTIVSHPEVNHFNKIIFDIPSPAPLVSIIILTRDCANLLEQCLKSILEKSTYENYEIIIVDNGSKETETFELFTKYKKDNITVLRNDVPFNFSALNNFAVEQAKGELICLLNNDIKVLTPNWLEEMVSFAIQPDIGCVGARLWYPDMRLQHGGIILGIGENLAEHSHKFLKKGELGYMGRAVVQQSISAVTAACLVVKKSIYLQVNGMNEELRVAYNDIDFCLKVRKAGFRNIWTPFAELIHYESATRGHDYELEKQARFFEEQDLMQSRWGEQLINDPAYSPNLSRDKEGWSYRV